MIKAIQEYNFYKNQILMVPFVTMTDYLRELEDISKLMSSYSSIPKLTYLAAAVSDFYIPPEKMVEHKIQSREYGDGGLDLHLEPTPKRLGHIKNEWNINDTESIPKPFNETFLVSFKLETDLNILE